MLGLRRTFENGRRKTNYFWLMLYPSYSLTMRPSTLNLRHQQNHDVSRDFLREAFKVWSARSQNNVVPEHNIQTLFYELKHFLTVEQVHDMLRTANLLFRNCNDYRKSSNNINGLTFGEFSVLLSDLRKLRYTSIINCHDIIQTVEPSRTDTTSLSSKDTASKRQLEYNETICGPEVFLGGSCNPTTWRADVAIPTLNRLGISFYNPQVSEWTPDLLELEHRAKEKAKVLFFVMDSQTRSTAGAIEVAHIAGKNSKHLVLVLLPYRQHQQILDETLSADEFVELSRNQVLLKQLVRRRGLPVLDDISLALEYIKNIISGRSCREHPQNIATRLISIRRTYDRIVDNSNYVINLTQCRRALIELGYPAGIASISVFKKILNYFGEISEQSYHVDDSESSSSLWAIVSDSSTASNDDNFFITFECFCILDSYLSVLHQDILETSCVSPIKGTNFQQPPIYLTDSSGWSHTSRVRLPSEEALREQIQIYPSPDTKPIQEPIHHVGPVCNASCSNLSTPHLSSQLENQLTVHQSTNEQCRNRNSSTSLELEDNRILKTRDLYLGGSCSILSNWRQEHVIPFLKARNITFYLSTLNEGRAQSKSNSLPKLNDDELIFNPSELDASRILLFVITNESRSLTAMTMAAHYIGMGYNIVMCVQMLTNGCIVGGSKLSDSAVKDYNRGRAYLVDLAKRHGIPVFNDINATIRCAVEKLKLHK